MKWKTAILWFRNDLRLHDHEALYKAVENVSNVIPVYCLDPRHFALTQFQFPKTGPFRAQFLLESLADLRQNLRARGSELLIRIGHPEQIIPAIAAEYEAGGVFFHQETTAEELAVEAKMEAALFARGIAMEGYWSSTLYHLSDLPMPVKALPDIFAHFRKEVERFALVRAEFETPATIPTPTISEPGELPELNRLGLTLPARDPRQQIFFRGGEQAGLARMEDWFWAKDRLKEYKQTRNGLLGEDYSSKFSPWLALGCLSPRRVFHEINRYEKARVKNSSTYWLKFELIWRDYFRFVARKYENAIFQTYGIRQMAPSGWPRLEPEQQSKNFQKWCEGKTGLAFIDANMQELAATGFMSNRGRQNVASYLIKDLGVDWRWGASWFESQLIDYDVCSNWGNWMYIAGVGNDPRENRYFNIPSQAARYDPDGAYVSHWLKSALIG